MGATATLQGMVPLGHINAEAAGVANAGRLSVAIVLNPPGSGT
jgi:hypothetical protein